MIEYKIYFPLDIYIQEYFESPVQVSGFDWFSWGVKTSSQHCTRSKMAHTAADTEVLSMLNTRHWRLYIFALCQHNHNTLKTLELIILSTEHILYTGLHSGEEEKKKKPNNKRINVWHQISCVMSERHLRPWRATALQWWSHHGPVSIKSQNVEPYVFSFGGFSHHKTKW